MSSPKGQSPKGEEQRQWLAVARHPVHRARHERCSRLPRARRAPARYLPTRSPARPLAHARARAPARPPAPSPARGRVCPRARALATRARARPSVRVDNGHTLNRINYRNSWLVHSFKGFPCCSRCFQKSWFSQLVGFFPALVCFWHVFGRIGVVCLDWCSAMWRGLSWFTLLWLGMCWLWFDIVMDFNRNYTPY